MIDVLIASIKARKALWGHKCEEHPVWCPHHDIGCDEAMELMRKDGDLFDKALEEIKKYEDTSLAQEGK